MKNLLNREIIEGLNSSSNENFAENVTSTVFSLVSDAIEKICIKSPFVQLEKCNIIPVNEIYLGAFSQLSEYSYFLGVENTEIEFNSKVKKNWWKYLWREFKASWRIGRKKKYKKKKRGEEEAKKTPVTIEKYKVSDLKKDLMYRLADQITETSMVYEFPYCLSLVGSDDFGTGVKINIYVTIYDASTDTYKLYKESKNKFISVNCGKRYENLDKKYGACGAMFVSMAKIFNSLFSKIYDKIPNQIVLESLLANCPDVLYDKNDVYKTFVNVANYIRIRNPKTFTSICDSSKTLFEDPLVFRTNAQADYGKIINMLDRFKY